MLPAGSASVTVTWSPVWTAVVAWLVVSVNVDPVAAVTVEVAVAGSDTAGDGEVLTVALCRVLVTVQVTPVATMAAVMVKVPSASGWAPLSQVRVVS